MRYAKTETGQAAFKERSPLFSSRQRSAFLLCDGRKTEAEVLSATAGLGVTRDDLAHLVSVGFLQVAEVARFAPVSPELATITTFEGSSPDGDGGTAAALSLTPAERYRRAYPIATRLTASLGLRGFRLNVAVEAASGCDDLLQLLPRIAEAVGAEKAAELERALREP